MDLTQTELTLAELYTFTTTDGAILSVTSHDTDIIYNGNTYQKLPITRTPINYHTNLQVDKVDISMGLVGVKVGTKEYSIPKLIRLGLLRNAHVLIHLVDYVALGIASLLFEGWITEGISYNKGVVTLNVGSILDKLNEKFPKYIYSEYCNHQLYSTYCGLVKNNYKESGTVATGSVVSRIYSTIFSFSAHPPTYAPAYVTYNGVSKSITTEDIEPRGICFSSNGSKMYIAGNANDKIFEYGLSTPWLVSSATYNGVFKSVEDTQARSPVFNSDGSKMYIMGLHNHRVFEYDLSTPWLVSSAIYNSVYKYVGGQDTIPYGIFFKPDGTKIYLMGNGADRVFEYDLSTPWLVSSATYNGVSKLITAQDTQPVSVFFTSDGAKMHVLGFTNKSIFEYDLSTPWLVSSATYNGVSKKITEDSQPYGIFFKPDSAKMYLIGNQNDSIFEYEVASTGNYWAKGEIKMTSGENLNLSRTIIKHSDGYVDLLIPFPESIVVGVDTFDVWPGCDKSGTTCCLKFSNYGNFFGFEYTPKPEVLLP